MNSCRNLVLAVVVFFALLFWMYIVVVSMNESSSEGVGFGENMFVDFNHERSKWLFSLYDQTIDKFSDQKSDFARSKLNFDFCPLPNLDPWDSSVRDVVRPKSDPLRQCKPTIDQLTILVNGSLILKQHTNVTDCVWRSLVSHHDYDLTYGDWVSLVNGTVPECDVLEVRCFREGIRNVSVDPSKVKADYEFLHAQVYRSDEPSPTPTPTTEVPPNVFVILFDSVSMSHFFRSMPKTTFFLREELEAFSFRHLNKVGLNSRPNAFALLMGKQIYDIGASPMSVGYASDFPNNSYCDKNLNFSDLIHSRFKEAGYVTSYSEDWALRVFNWPNCKGFAVPMADHQMHPYQMRVDSAEHKSRKLEKNVFQNSCNETFHRQIQYLEAFIHKYPDRAKFSLTWMINLAHNDINALQHTDEYFYQFFRRNKETFRKSFVWVIGDHGMRFGPIRQTAVGAVEDFNPAMFLSVPDSLKEDAPAMAVMRTNSKQLVTHFDSHATFVAITQMVNRTLPEPSPYGSSLLHPLPTPRTCDRLRIPFVYCLCEFERTPLPQTDPMRRTAVEFAIAHMNEVLSASTDTRGRCAPLALNSSTSVEVHRFADRGELWVFEVHFTTSPGNGQFSAFLSAPQNSLHSPSAPAFTVLSQRFPRADRYAEQAFCASTAVYASYCFCNELLTNLVPME